MDNGILKMILIILQYASITISGVLGILGIKYNYKEKETGKLTKVGKTALIVLACSLTVGIVSKTIELEIKRRSDLSEAQKARIASEQTLKVSTNVERVVNAINDIHVELNLSISLKSHVFDDFRNQLFLKLGDGNNNLSDQDFSPDEFQKLLPSPKWTKFVQGLLPFDPKVLIYPKESKIPECITTREEYAPFEFGIEKSINGIEYPEQETRFLADFSDKVQYYYNKNSQLISFVDFKDATIVCYSNIPIKTSANGFDSTTHDLHNANLNFEKQFPAAAWKFTTLYFRFDANRLIRVNLEQKIDSCSGQSYFIGKTGE